MKLIILFVVSFFTASVAFSEPLTKEQKDIFVKFYRAWSKFHEEFPDHPELRVLFFDLDHDGTDEAIATHQGQFGETGYSWSVFRLANSIWSCVEEEKISDSTIDPMHGIFARTEEFYSLALIRKPLGLIIIRKDYDKRATDGMATPRVFSINLNKDGSVKAEKIASLDQLVGYSEDFHKVHRLGIETFKD